MLKKCIAAVLFLLFTSSICHKSPVEPEPANVVAEKFEYALSWGYNNMIKTMYSIVLFNSGDKDAYNVSIKVQWYFPTQDLTYIFDYALFALCLPKEVPFPVDTRLSPYQWACIAAGKRTPNLWVPCTLNDVHEISHDGIATLLDISWNE